MLTEGIDTFVGTANNDLFQSVNSGGVAGKITLGGLDSIDGGAGKDTFNITDTVTATGTQYTLPAGLTVKNVETVKVSTNGGINMDVKGFTGLTSFTSVAAGTANTAVIAADTTDVTTTVAGAATTTITGGKVVNATASTGLVTITGDALTSVTVKGGTANVISNTVSGAGITGTTLKSVTLDGMITSTAINGNAVDTITLKNQKTAATATLTNTVSKALTVNVDGVGYNAAGAVVAVVAAGAAAETITVNATGAKSNVTVSAAAAKTLNITGTADLVLAPVATATKIDGSTATGGLTLGTLNAVTTNVATGSGKDTFTLSATAKATVDSGAGDDIIALASAVAAGSTINLGDGNDTLLVGGAGSVAASTTTVIDGGAGNDSLAAALVNAANASQFKNFENLDLTNAATLDVELMTASTITGLTLSAGAKAATTVTNVAAGIGLTVLGHSTAATTTTIGVKGATTSTTDTFAITFDAKAASTATAIAPSNNDAATIKVDDVETISINSKGTGFVTNDLILIGSKLQTLTITGDKELTVDFAATTGTNTGAGLGGAVKLIDGSAATGKLNINTTNVTADDKVGVGLTIKGGSADDSITLAQAATVDAGAGNDTIKMATFATTMTGGAGNDTFDVISGKGNTVLATITDLSAGDKVKFADFATGFTSTKLTLDASVVDINSALTFATLAANNSKVVWFNYGSDTYIVNNDTNAGLGADDTVVKLNGIKDLSNSTFDAATDTLTIA